MWGEHAVSPACVGAPSSPSLAPGDSSFQPLLWHLKCSSGSQWLLKRSLVHSVHIHLPAMGLHQTAGLPSPWFLSPLDPRQGQREGGQRWLAGVMVLRWEDHTRPLENGTFLHLVTQTSLRSKVFKVRHRSKLWIVVGVHPLVLGLRRCVDCGQVCTRQDQSCLQQFEANLALGFSGQQGRVGQGRARQGRPGESKESRTRTVATVCRHRTSASDNATAGVFWAQF